MVVNKLLLTFYYHLRKLFHIGVEMPYGNFSIFLPPGHKLDLYQKLHPKYDRFLPVLVEALVDGGLVVDVGANVGDTLASMVERNPSLEYLCIEADDDFFQCLERNIKKINAHNKNTSIRAHKKLIGKSISGVSLAGDGGSKHAIINSINGIKSISLDELLCEDEKMHLRLLKSDVDGFDYDVLDSAGSALVNNFPILYFECQLDDGCQKDGYRKTIESLRSMGYSNWVVFDNFGLEIMRTKEISIVHQLLEYLWSQNMEISTRTLFYYDLMAYHENDSKLVDGALSKYSIA